MMQDPIGRTIRYLRLSLTSACQMRCTYCRPARMARLAGTGEVDSLTTREIERVASHLVTHHGLRKIRLTGGDPTARPDLVEIIERVARIPGLVELTMTTNGLTLARCAREYAAAGLDRVNVSLDSLDRERFARITGVDGLDRVLKGIDHAVAAGLTPVKINTVVMRGTNLDELPGLIEFATRRGLEVRFIELMPMGPLADRWADRYVCAAEMRRRLSPVVREWTAMQNGAAAAKRYRAILMDGQCATVGFITPMSCDFCAACDRVRITSNGDLYPCLMDRPAGNVLSAVRPNFQPNQLDRLLFSGIAQKKATHPATGFVTMTTIGG